MNASNVNHSNSNIDKYAGSFEQDELGVTIIPTETIRLLTDFTLLALFTFLASCPSDWKLIPQQLANHFGCHKDKIYKALDRLIQLKLLIRTEIRDNGKFAQFKYRLYLRQIVQVTPFPDFTDTVKPDTENPDAYKTYIYNKTEKLKNTTTTEIDQEMDSTTTNEIAEDKSSSSFFSPKQKDELLKTKLSTDRRSDDEFLANCEWHIQKQDNEFNKFRRIKGLLRILDDMADAGEHFKAHGFDVKPKFDLKKETDTERQERQYFEYELMKEREREGYVSEALKKYPEMRKKYGLTGITPKLTGEKDEKQEREKNIQIHQDAKIGRIIQKSVFQSPHMSIADRLKLLQQASNANQS